MPSAINALKADTYVSWMFTHANVNVSYLAQHMDHADITMVAKVYGKWLTESNKKKSDIH